MKKLTSQEIKEFVSKPLFDDKVILNKDSSWPKISIVTPSYNQAHFLERTILSILNQNYPNLEYIIIDGGSTDGSVDIIKKYEKYISYWLSEEDKGQADAINKGFEKSSGEILAYLNSDDTYLKGTLFYIAKCFQENIDISIAYGNIYFIDKEDKIIKEGITINYDFNIHLYDGAIIPQPAAFWRRTSFLKVGGFNEDLDLAMDGEFWFRLAAVGFKFYFIDIPLANFRLHNASKSIRVRKQHKCEAQAVREHILERPFTKYETIIKRFHAKVNKKWKRLKLDMLKMGRKNNNRDLQQWSIKNKKYFDYDAINFADNRWLGSQKAYYDYELTKDFLLKTLNPQFNDNIIEIGCGPGIWTKLISEKCKSLVAIDISGNMIKQAKSRVRTQNVRFKQVDFSEYESVKVYDKVFSIRAIEYLSDLVSTVEKISKIVKKGGKISIITKTTPTLITIRANSWQKLKSILLRKNGLSELSLKHSMRNINPFKLKDLFMHSGATRVNIFPVVLRFPFLFIHDRYKLPFVNVHYQQVYEQTLLKICNSLSKKFIRMPKLFRYIFLFFSETYLLEVEK
jgi:glycosyltransferase involved in cell wall biosynthesis